MQHICKGITAGVQPKVFSLLVGVPRTYPSSFPSLPLCLCCFNEDFGTSARGAEKPGPGSAGLGRSNQGAQFAQERRHQRGQKLPEPTPGRPDCHERRVPSPVGRPGLSSVHRRTLMF